MFILCSFALRKLKLTLQRCLLPSLSKIKSGFCIIFIWVHVWRKSQHRQSWCILLETWWKHGRTAPALYRPRLEVCSSPTFTVLKRHTQKKGQRILLNKLPYLQLSALRFFIATRTAGLWAINKHSIQLNFLEVTGVKLNQRKPS